MDAIRLILVGPAGWDWMQVVDILLAFVLSSLIGFEREIRMKSAGLRTHALVGLATALLILISKYGFTDVLVDEHLRLDPSRVAAQVVSGIGFIGGGLIFVRKDIVHGLTTAATIWLTAAIGMACGAGMHLLALMTCGGYFLVVFGYTACMQRALGRSSRLYIRYRVGYDAMAGVISLCTLQEFSLLGFSTEQPEPGSETAGVEIRLRGKAAVQVLANDISSLPAVVSVELNPPEK
ncbi:MAG: MgtC/SapB family protein [Deltaproteobacteria bacterium]|jgi:putative Mg2+ transporter-C (MgtC) family protein|nr:MgtC/SapB family protein [Deltaproteobacteria bacterium]